MKKTTLFLLAFSMSFAGFSQGLFFRLGLGYAMPQAGQTMYDTPIPYNIFPTGISGTRNNSNNYDAYNIKGASFSSGMQGTIGFGYMFSPNAGVQLDACIGLSTKKYTFTDDSVSLNTGSGTILGRIVTTQQAKTPILLMPSLVLQTGGKKLNLYTRFGIALPLKTKVTQVQEVTNLPGAGMVQVTDYTWQIKSNFSVGFTGAAGVKYKLNDRVTVWGEVSLLSMALYTKEQDLTDLSQDGHSYPLSYYSYAKTIKFSKNAVVDSNLANMPTYDQPFSNLSFNVGVTFNLSERKRSRLKNSDEDSGDTPKRSTPYRRR